MAQKRVKCKQCGFRIRGKNHENGPHHKEGKYKSYTPPGKKRRY